MFTLLLLVAFGPVDDVLDQAGIEEVYGVLAQKARQHMINELSKRLLSEKGAVAQKLIREELAAARKAKYYFPPLIPDEVKPGTYGRIVGGAEVVAKVGNETRIEHLGCPLILHLPGRLDVPLGAGFRYAPVLICTAMRDGVPILEHLPPRPAKE